jgi:PAS domain S-box-containing protein
MNIWQKLINAEKANPDDARRSQLLNILLIGLGFAISAVVVLLVGVFAVGLADEYEIEPQLLITCLSTLAGVVLIYILGRYISGRLASSLLIILFTIMLFMGDNPQESIGGRSSSFFILPIIMASMLLRPSASFIVMGVIFIMQSLLGAYLGVLPNFLIGTGYFIAALISWLSAHTLEQVIKELRLMNQELDRRVAERTQTLNETLIREQDESSRNRAILHSIADSVMVFNLEGKLMQANPMVSRLTGLPLEKITGKSLREMMDKAVSVEQQDAVEQIFQAPQANTPIQVQWGQAFYSLSYSPVSLESGEISGVVVVFHNVTPEVEVSRIKSAFVAMVSHELRTPLSAMMGLVEILQHNLLGPLTEKQNDLVTRLFINVQKLAQLVEDLLDHAKIEAGTLTIHPTGFAPRELLYTVTDSLNEMAGNKNLTLIKEIDPNLPVALMGDTRRLSQVLNNLVTNAIKYTDRGQIYVRFKQLNEHHWCMQVQDTGVGISPEAQHAVFEAFWQADNSIARRQGGVGLGLSIVKRLVNLMNGEIHLESEVGVGSIFTVTFPLQQLSEFEHQQNNP